MGLISQHLNCPQSDRGTCPSPCLVWVHCPSSEAEGTHKYKTSEMPPQVKAASRVEVKHWISQWGQATASSEVKACVL